MNFQLRLLRGLQTNVWKIESKPPEKFKHKCGLQIYFSLANLEVLKKSPEKPGDWDLKPGDFQKYWSN